MQTRFSIRLLSSSWEDHWFIPTVNMQDAHQVYRRRMLHATGGTNLRYVPEGPCHCCFTWLDFIEKYCD